MKNFLLSSLLFLVLGTVSALAQTVILDFETPATTTNYEYFGNSSLNGQQTMVVANPNATGDNTSANVAEFVKSGGALTWAGAFPNPALTVPIDLTDGGQVCFKVLMDHVGSASLKLESSIDGVADWITTVENTVANEWEELCFESALPSIEAPFTPASGSVYDAVILFFDFGTAGTGVDVTSYFDDLLLKTGGGEITGDITFTVNMSEYSGSFTGVNVGGTFNEWTDEHPLTDNGDGTWSTTITLSAGAYEYLFFTTGDIEDEWEAFEGIEECTVTTYTDTEQFTNRVVVVSEDVSLDPTCFNSCYNCGDGINITFEIAMGEEVVSEDGVFLAGGGNFGHGQYRMTDPEDDGVYSITIERLPGFESDYTFINGICLPNWECKEDIIGQDCAVGEFSDRHFDPIFESSTISTCFALCTDEADCTTTISIDELESNTYFSIVPNLTSDIANLYFNSTESGKRISLINISGQVLDTKVLSGKINNYRWVVANYTSGVYFIQVEVDGQVSTQKLIVE